MIRSSSLNWSKYTNHSSFILIHIMNGYLTNIIDQKKWYEKMNTISMRKMKMKSLNKDICMIQSHEDWMIFSAVRWYDRSINLESNLSLLGKYSRTKYFMYHFVDMINEFTNTFSIMLLLRKWNLWYWITWDFVDNRFRVDGHRSWLKIVSRSILIQNFFVFSFWMVWRSVRFDDDEDDEIELIYEEVDKRSLIPIEDERSIFHFWCT